MTKTKKNVNEDNQPITTKEEILQKYKSIDDIIKEPVFVDFVKLNIYELIKKRNNRPEAKHGYRYKRDWFDKMSDKGTLNHNYFIQQIEAIWLRKSSLSSQERNVIQYVCDISLEQTISELSRQLVLNHHQSVAKS